MTLLHIFHTHKENIIIIIINIIKIIIVTNTTSRVLLIRVFKKRHLETGETIEKNKGGLY